METAGRPAWVLFGSQGYFGDDVNETTATASTRGDRTIKASFFPAPPPHPSKLCVHCPGATAEGIEAPRVLAVAGDLILFRVAIETGGLLWVNRPLSLVQCDYFIYRADPNRPMLRRLPRIGRPRTYFQDYEVGILPRGDDDYTIAALIPSNGKFRLLTFRSEAWAWSVSVKLPVGEEKRFPIKLPPGESNLAGHLTTNVVTIGGEHGTMGWVDLWRGIVFCDVLREPATLRSIPMPLPMNQIIGGREHLGRGMNSRGVAFVKGAGGGCLKFVELELDAVDVSGVNDDETGFPILLVKGWSVTTWSNTGMSSRYEDWQEDLPAPVHAWQIRPDDSAVFSHSQQQKQHGAGLRLVLPAQGGGYCCEKAATTTMHSLQKLVVTDPYPSLDGDDVVYLVARPKLWYPKTWILALDMKNNTLQAVVPFGILEEPDPNVIYCTSSLLH